MSFRIRCPQCQKILQVPDKLLGRRAICPACKSDFSIPSPAGSAHVVTTAGGLTRQAGPAAAPACSSPVLTVSVSSPSTVPQPPVSIPKSVSPSSTYKTVSSVVENVSLAVRKVTPHVVSFVEKAKRKFMSALGSGRLIAARFFTAAETLIVLWLDEQLKKKTPVDRSEKTQAPHFTAAAVTAPANSPHFGPPPSMVPILPVSDAVDAAKPTEEGIVLTLEDEAPSPGTDLDKLALLRLPPPLPSKSSERPIVDPPPLPNRDVVKEGVIDERKRIIDIDLADPELRVEYHGDVSQRP